MGVLTPLVSDITATGLSLVGDVTAEELGLQKPMRFSADRSRSVWT